MTNVAKSNESMDTQWQRLCSIHCATWNGVRSWYDADGRLQRSVVAERILAQVSDELVIQINNYLEEGVVIHHEEWDLERSEDDNTFFPAIPTMKSYFAKDGAAFWGRHYTPGEPFKFEVFYMRGDHRMSVMPRWDANGSLEGYMHVREVRENAPVRLWSKEVKTVHPIDFSGLTPPKGKALLATINGGEFETETSFKEGACRSLLEFPDGLTVDLPRQLPNDGFDVFIQWCCGEDAPEKVVARFPGINQSPQFIRFN